MEETKVSIAPKFDRLDDPTTFQKHVEEIIASTGEPQLDIQPSFTSYSEYTGEQKPIRIAPNQYAYGIWLFTAKAGMASIDGVFRDGFIDLVHRLGFQKRYKNDGIFQYVLVRNNILKAIDIANIRDALTAVIKTAEGIGFDHAGLRFEATAEIQKEKFLRNSPSLLNDAVLGHLPNHDSPVMRDTASEMFFPFQNCVVKVTRDGICYLEYSSMKDTFIWQDHISNRPVALTDEYKSAQFAGFISNVAAGNPDRIASFVSALGYLLHCHSNPTTARAVIAYDEQLAKRNEPQGGSGKGLFAQAIGQLRSVSTIDGKKIKEDNPFSYQQVNERSHVISFDDVKPDFDFLMLNSNLTTGWQIEHKHKPAFRFPQSENPKTYITSNSILKAEGTTAERRQFILTFSSHYMKLVRQKIEPIIHEHGSMFFSDEWEEDEWNRFYSYMFHCCKNYLTEGLIFYEHTSFVQNKLIQQTSDDFFEWINENPPSLGREINITVSYLSFRDQYYGQNSDFKQRTFTNWLKTHALSNRMTLTTKRSNGNTIGVFTSNQYTSTQDSIAEGNPPVF